MNLPFIVIPGVAISVWAGSAASNARSTIEAVSAPSSSQSNSTRITLPPPARPFPGRARC